MRITCSPQWNKNQRYAEYSSDLFTHWAKSSPYKLWNLLNISRNVTELAAIALTMFDSYLRECMKFSRLYSDSYCSWSQRSLRFSRIDFILAFPEVEVSAFSAFPSLRKIGRKIKWKIINFKIYSFKISYLFLTLNLLNRVKYFKWWVSSSHKTAYSVFSQA